MRSRKAGNVIALYHPLVIVHVARKLDGDEIGVLRDIVAEGLREGIEGGMLFVFARDDMTGGLDPRARELFEQLVRKASASVGLSAVVIASEGFAGAVVRGFIAGLLQLVTRRGKLKSYPTVADACRALAQDHGLDATKLEATYRAAVGAP